MSGTDIEQDNSVDEVSEDVKKLPIGLVSDTRYFPCRRPEHANSRLYEFERYLELTGVVRHLSLALGALCAQNPKPLDPLHFMVEKMCEIGQVGKWSECVFSLRSELSELKTLIMYAQKENERRHAFFERSEKLKLNPEEIDGEVEEEKKD